MPGVGSLLSLHFPNLTFLDIASQVERNGEVSADVSARVAPATRLWGWTPLHKGLPSPLWSDDTESREAGGMRRLRKKVKVKGR